MSAEIQIRKLPDGRIQARRRDGRPLTEGDRQEVKRLAGAAPDREAEPPLRAWVIQEITDPTTKKLRAVELCSALIEDHLWLIFDRSFEPKDGLAIYYPEELSELKTKSLEQLREIHRVKLVFPGCRIIQEGADDE